jgi:hypothetical protein
MSPSAATDQHPIRGRARGSRPPGIATTERVPSGHAARSCPYRFVTRFGGRQIPATGERIEAITWIHDREEWTAKVGERLRGTRTRRGRRRGQTLDVTERLSDGATVLAIFAAVPYFVVTDAPPIGRAASAWSNPFMAGDPHVLSRFDS